MKNKTLAISADAGIIAVAITMIAIGSMTLIVLFATGCAATSSDGADEVTVSFRQYRLASESWNAMVDTVADAGQFQLVDADFLRAFVPIKDASKQLLDSWEVALREGRPFDGSVVQDVLRQMQRMLIEHELQSEQGASNGSVDRTVTRSSYARGAYRISHRHSESGRRHHRRGAGLHQAAA